MVIAHYRPDQYFFFFFNTISLCNSPLDQEASVGEASGARPSETEPNDGQGANPKGRQIISILRLTDQVIVLLARLLASKKKKRVFLKSTMRLVASFFWLRAVREILLVRTFINVPQLRAYSSRFVPCNIH